MLSSYVAVGRAWHTAVAASKASGGGAHDIEDPVVAVDSNLDSGGEEEKAPTGMPEIFPSHGSSDYRRAACEDRQKRVRLLMECKDEPRVLFVVPTEPLVWQVGAYFSRIFREARDGTQG